MPIIMFLSLVASLGVLVDAAPAPRPQSAESRVVIVEPQPDSFLTGEVVLKAVLEPPTIEITRTEFFVDGVSVCRVTIAPFECPFDAGPSVKVRQVRVAMLLANGTRLVETIRTKGLDLDEAVRVNAVLVPVVVWDWRGKFVPGLTRESFAITEDSKPQQIQFFQAEDIPLELAVTIDISQSMAPIIEKVKASIRSFMARLKPIDRVTLVAFNERAFVLMKSETDPKRRDEAVARLSPQGGTAIYDALVRSADLLGQQISRRAIIAFTDGQDQDSLATIQSVEDRLSSTDVSLYLIAYGKPNAVVASEDRLAKLTEMTGGRVYQADKPEDLVGIFKEVIEDLSQHYLLGYTPTNAIPDGTVRKIAVTVPSKGSFQLKFRNSYRSPSAKP